MISQCKRCNDILRYADELEYGVCEACLDLSAARHRERQEWFHYHPDDALPTPPEDG